MYEYIYISIPVIFHVVVHKAHQVIFNVYLKYIQYMYI